MFYTIIPCDHMKDYLDCPRCKPKVMCLCGKHICPRDLMDAVDDAEFKKFMEKLKEEYGKKESDKS